MNLNQSETPKTGFLVARPNYAPGVTSVSSVVQLKIAIWFLWGYKYTCIDDYYIPVNDITFELSVFWLSDTGSRINELRLSISFETRLTSVTCFCGDVA